MRKPLICMALGLGIALTGTARGAILLQQDFDDNAPLSSYVSPTPDTTQFSDFFSASANNTHSIVEDAPGDYALRMQRGSSGAQMGFTRVDLATKPATLRIQFDFEMTTTASTALARFVVGENFALGAQGDDQANDAGALRFTSIRFDPLSDGSFQLLSNGGTASSGSWTGRQRISLFLNDSGSSQDYTGPDGTEQSVGHRQLDVWVGETLVFNNFGSVNAAAGLEDIKYWSYWNISDTFIDNIVVDTALSIPEPAALPLLWLGGAALLGRRRHGTGHSAE